ncbi:hypothetical protein HU200_008470 [Digitaria exilis]|uniref:Gelsolin-like domain-containing protein n=1 Tax=Digitaria exilis TaxID=1010633 RepID=A0A835FMQ8_9POAL|nr:hypothetical protein HU200_008470 [Digitaria exilis]
MIPIQKAGLHFFEFRAQGLRICKLFKLIRQHRRLNSSYCYILHDGDTVFTWIGNLSSSMDQELAGGSLMLFKGTVDLIAQL